MKKYFLLFIYLPFFTLFAQSTKGRWDDLFSYGNVKFIENVQGLLYCATDNGIFLFNPQNPNADLIKYNKTNILSNVNISAVDYNAERNILMVGYENGAIDLLENGETAIVLDIPWNNFRGSKKINDIQIKDDIAFISGNFGITSYSLSQRQFLETTFFYSNGDYKPVNKSVVYNGKIYAATDSGLYCHRLVNNTNYPNFYAWEVVNGSESNLVGQLEVFDNHLYYTFWDDLYKRNSSDQVTLIGNFTGVSALNVTEDKLVLTQPTQINFISVNNQIVRKSLPYIEDYDLGNNQSTLMQFNTGYFYQNKYYGGSKRYGLIDFDIASTYQTNPNGYKPDGPYNNLAWSITARNNKIWITPGGADNYNVPNLNADGFYYFDKYDWNHFKSNALLNAKDFLRVAVNPKDDNHFVAVPYFEATNWDYTTRIGVMEIKLEGGRFALNHILTPLEWITRTSSATFDRDGNLFLASSFPDGNSRANYYYKRTGTNWRKTFVNKDNPSSALSPIFSEKYVWYPNARSGGLTVLDKELNEIITLTKANANLYDDGVLSTAVDQNNSIWIGTQLGLTVLNSADQAIDNANYQTSPIVIIQDGIPEALLTSIAINDIEVDKANRKWIATNSSGVYYVSDNGEQTIYHFTSKNSALPSDTVYDISIDDSTGKVYFATENGAVVFNGDVQDVGDKFNQALAYPNPVRPGFKGNVVIKNVPNRASVKITDVTGNLIFESKANGGIVEWNTKNSKGQEVASGIYLVLMTNQDGSETKTIKIAVVR